MTSEKRVVGISGRKKRQSADRVEEIFEKLLASKMRPKIGAGPGDIVQAIDKERDVLTGLPIKASGDVFYAGNDVIAVVGDLEILGGSTIDKSLVVKGKVTVGGHCRIVANLKALRGISIAEECLVKANIASGGVVALGAKTIVDGDVHAETVRLSEGAEVHGLVDAKRIQSVHSSIENDQSNQSIWRVSFILSFPRLRT